MISVHGTLTIFLSLLASLSAESPPSPNIFSGLGAPVPVNPAMTMGVVLAGKESCSAVLLSRYVALTAAHCVWETPANRLQFRWSPSAGKTVSLSVKEIHLCPDYRRGRLEDLGVTNEVELNDLAVLYLESTPVDLASLKFLPVSVKPQLFEGKKLRTMGFGASGGAASQSFRTLEVGLHRLFASPDRNGKLIPSQILAVVPTEGSATPCRGDRGGALVDDEKNGPHLVGLGSVILVRDETQAPQNCEGTLGALYTNVAHHRDWLMSHTDWNPAKITNKTLAPADDKSVWKTLPTLPSHPTRK